MNETSALLTLYATTFLHPGAGTSTGVVDLPVQREVHTHYPFLAASGLKGSLREKAEGLAMQDVDVLFGPEKGREAFAGCLSIGDGRLLAIPVRSIAHTFLWVTCPIALQRFLRDAALGGLNAPRVALSPIQNGEAWTPNADQPQMVLEDVEFHAVVRQEATVLACFIRDNVLPESIGSYYLEKFVKDFAIVSDSDFVHLSKHGTQISARIALTESKTTSDGGNLWYEETIPPETVFYSLLMARAPRNGDASRDAGDMMRLVQEILLADGFLRVGGNETVGQGWCLTRVPWEVR